MKTCGAYWSQNHTQRLQGTSIWWPWDANQKKGKKKIEEKDLPLQKNRKQNPIWKNEKKNAEFQSI